ncbi:Rieske (2Fe-2S) protein [Paraperlucidibaca wandonensis]|jgi:nitrite reductase/ring-hydroxylating ferredoxin subunit|uniref:Rieske (2Fe-2S) protein n=1 Tax=Paraperlucidibaca wandonensis TaxID=1268273 RepID=A0ABW3HJJ5_9GAMM|nr:Rieske (2Fe-2S) protein [Paraperlucidibaca sp.]MBQ0723552.1 Rieske (2Fe-2S) protein [Paraperlucidibaca sp.]MBQ0842383.1 Rieske (2Fe-2S) protein [Paraperlucidibaca sp.]|tara:strand:+ start:2104 stop:2427 length:324 start_codon:yes stop_codon:yes gene_type:complete
MGFRLCANADLVENEARAFRSPAGEVIVVNRDGQTYAYQNSCPHLGINLEFNPDEFMDSENYFLICSNHGALFQVEDGLCVSGPCQGESLLSVPIQIQDGFIELIEQ